MLYKHKTMFAPSSAPSSASSSASSSISSASSTSSSASSAASSSTASSSSSTSSSASSSSSTSSSTSSSASSTSSSTSSSASSSAASPLCKIEAQEACDWLRAAGFPQYVSFLSDCRFPVDPEWVKRDHDFLDKDALDAVCRRLNTVKKCVEMKLEPRRWRRRGRDPDEGDLCAISPHWVYDRRTQRWRRRASIVEGRRLPEGPGGPVEDVCSTHSSNSSSEGEGPDPQTPGDILGTSRSSSPCSPTKTPSAGSSLSGSPSPGGSSRGSSTFLEAGVQDRPPRRKGTSLLRKMEKLRLRGSTEAGTQTRRSSSSSFTVSSQSESSSAISSSQSESSSAISSSQSESSSPVTRVRRSNVKRPEKDQDHRGAEEVSRNQISGGGHDSVVFHVPQGHKPGTFPTSLGREHLVVNDDGFINWAAGSFHGCWGRHRVRHRSPSTVTDMEQRLSVYDNVPDEPPSEAQGGLLLDDEDVFSALDSVLQRISDLQQLVSSWTESLSEDQSHRGSSSCSSSSAQDSPDHGSSAASPRPSSPQPRPSSPDHIHLEVQHLEEEEPRSSRGSLDQLTPPPGLDQLTVSQILRLQKLALLKLTSLMDKHSPSSRQGWSWTVPSAQRKVLEVKGRRVFGAPLRRGGPALPGSILGALSFLRSSCLQQVGLFRKSGAKSRIRLLRERVEAEPDGVSFGGCSPFDVADLVKQFFRELPEPVFTARLRRCFLHVYQYFPKEQQLAAAQAAILLLPEENREALRLLLLFLQDVAASEDQNHMTPTNLAVCLAPSLFHLHTAQRDGGRSGHRKHSLGRPDQRDLSENLAAAQGLASMILEAQRLFQVPEFWPGQGRDPAGLPEQEEETNDPVMPSLT